MDRLLNWEQWRIVVVSTFSPILAHYTPTRGFVLALVLTFGFNIWAGMRADGVVIKRCKNFSFRKFKNALCELVLYLLIIELVYTIIISCGDAGAAVMAIKSLTYIFMYVYAQNAFRNLIVAYPKNVALRIVYHVIRLELTRAMPSHIQAVMDRLKNEIDKKEEDNECKN